MWGRLVLAVIATTATTVEAWSFHQRSAWCGQVAPAEALVELPSPSVWEDLSTKFMDVLNQQVSRKVPATTNWRAPAKYEECELIVYFAPHAGRALRRVLDDACGNDTGTYAEMHQVARGDYSLYTRLAVVRDPIDRLLGVYNAFPDVDMELGYLEERDARQIRTTLEPKFDDVVWRFWLFLKWYREFVRYKWTTPNARAARFVAHSRPHVSYYLSPHGMDTKPRYVYGPPNALARAEDVRAVLVALKNPKFRAALAKKPYVLENIYPKLRSPSKNSPWTVNPCHLADDAIFQKIDDLVAVEYLVFGADTFAGNLTIRMAPKSDDNDDDDVADPMR